MTNYFKLTNDSGLHNGVQYTTGLIVDPMPYNASVICGSGLYFASYDYIYMWFSYNHHTMVWIYDVEIPSDALVTQFAQKSKADRIILSNKRTIHDFINQQPDEWLVKMIRYNYSNMSRITNKSRVFLQAVFEFNRVAFIYMDIADRIRVLHKNPILIHMLPNPSKAEQFAAIATDISHFRLIRIPCQEVRAIALRTIPNIISELPNPTEEEIEIARTYQLIIQIKGETTSLRRSQRKLVRINYKE